MAGWIAISRRLLESPEWTAEKFTKAQAWIDLICLARYEPGEVTLNGRRLVLQRGQLAWSAVQLAKRWKWSRGKVERYLMELQTEQRLERRTSRVTSVITVTNYERYQHGGATDGATDGATGVVREPPTGQPAGQRTKQPVGQPTEQPGNANVPLPGRTNRESDSPSSATDGATHEATDSATNGAQTNKRTIQQPPPPTPSTGSEGWGEGWKDLAEELSQLGVATARDALTAAHNAGCGLEDVRGLIEHYRAGQEPSPPAWGAGALAARITAMVPGGEPAQGWPLPNAEHAAVVDRLALAEERRRDEQRQRLERWDRGEGESRRWKVRDRLEAMTAAEREKLEREVFSDTSELHSSRRDPTGHKRALLDHLAENHEARRQLVAAGGWEDL